jgi:D-3-phosphoglycerate dehydrogenase
MNAKVLICTSTFAVADKAPLELLAKHQVAYVLNPHKRTLKEDEVIALAQGCTGIISGSEPLTERVLASLPDLRCISRVGVGVDNIDLPAAEKRGIAIRNTPDAPTRAVAELTVGLIFDLLRGISRHDREIRQGTWNKKLGLQIRGREIGIVGLGRIGRAVAEMLAALGARVSGYDLYPDRDWAARYGVSIRDLGDVLAGSDVVTVHVPFVPGKAALIGEAEIRTMRSGAYLLNLSRGGIVDEDALLRALQEGRLDGAAIDTFVKEPYRGPLAGLDTVVLTPHMGSFTAESRAAMELDAVKNLLGVLGAGKDTL